jgi:hypothetical protein
MVSSNLLYYDALWSTVKRSSSLQSFRKYFYWDKEGRAAMKYSRANPKGKHTYALADIVADDGRTWIRVSALSQKRLLYELAKLGWMNDSDSESDEDVPNVRRTSSSDENDDEDQVDIVRNARDLARAAKANPVLGRPPKVQFVLTRIVSGKLREIDTIVAKIRATGATVQCANDIPPTPPLEEVLPNLLIDRSRAISDTLNIDCTILMALVSDISHRDCPILDWYPGEVRAQITDEATEHLLPTQLYPAISSRAMVTTREAAEQMNVIVDTLATDTERARAGVLLAQGNYETYSSDKLHAEWLSLSDYAVPDGFKLPIRVVSIDTTAMISKLPAVASRIDRELGALNSSIFLYGWAEGITTLSANRARARQINQLINEQGLEEGDIAPHIWLCGEPRSLIAKHGRRH